MEDDLLFGYLEGMCHACDGFTQLNDIGLCEDCNGKMDRDLVRQRDWAYSSSAFGCPVDMREELRRRIIVGYDKENELLADEPPRMGRSKSRRGWRKKKR